MAIVRKHIQVIDDDVSMRVYLRTLLQREGYRVTEVDNPISVTFRDPAQAPDLVILDLNMPGLDGYGVCREYKNDQSFKAPILVLSGMAEPEHIKAALDAGADAFLTKPVDSDTLLGKVTELISAQTK